MWENWELYQHAPKIDSIGFRYIIFSIDLLSRQNHTINFATRKPQELKVKIYKAHMTGIKKYLDIITGSKSIQKLEMQN